MLYVQKCDWSKFSFLFLILKIYSIKLMYFRMKYENSTVEWCEQIHLFFRNFIRNFENKCVFIFATSIINKLLVDVVHRPRHPILVYYTIQIWLLLIHLSTVRNYIRLKPYMAAGINYMSRSILSIFQIYAYYVILKHFLSLIL